MRQGRQECRIEGCVRAVHAEGMCETHYLAFYVHGVSAESAHHAHLRTPEARAAEESYARRLQHRRALPPRQRVAEERKARWDEAVREALERWPEQAYLDGRPVHMSTDVVEAYLGTAEFVRRRDAALEQADKEKPAPPPRPRASGPGDLSVKITRPTG